MLSKKIYQLKSNLLEEGVGRSYNELRWLHDLLKNEFPHVSLPSFPDRDKNKLNEYFNRLISVRPLRKSKSLIFFVGCTNKKLFDDFKLKRGFKKDAINFGALKNKFSSINKFSLTEIELEELTKQADKINNNTKINNENLLEFIEKMKNLTSSTSDIFKQLNKTLAEIKRQLEDVTEKFRFVTDLFSNLVLNAHDMNSSNLGLSESYIESSNLEKMFSKFKILFSNNSILIRCFLWSSCRAS